MNRLKYILLGLVAIFSNIAVFSQGNYCSVTVSPSDTTICLGDSVYIGAVGVVLDGNQAFDFNSSSVPPGWSTTGSNYFTSPCGNSPDNTPYYWAATSSSSTPSITSASYDVSCGGEISFQMIYAVQNGPSPCEGPDEQNEGVSLEYSTDGGVTWVVIIYYMPNGTTTNYVPTSSGNGITGQTPFTTWATYTVPIPASAYSANTIFRWIQHNSTSSANDNWGMDNIVINGSDCNSANVVINWSNGLLDTDSQYVNANDYNSTNLVVYVYDTLGVLQCQSDTITIAVYPDQVHFNLVDTVYSYCPATNPGVGVTNLTTAAIPPYTYDWSNGSTTDTTSLSTGGAEHDTITYYVTVYDGCNYNRQDSVVLIVNKQINIDSLIQFPASACANDGVVMANDPSNNYASTISGATTTPAHGIYYTWNGPGSTNPSSYNASTWTNRSSGWYYLYVEDAVCSDYDSVYVEQLPPPQASFTVSDSTGCIPLEVTFTNTSDQVESYTWNFGNGTITNVTDLSSQTQSYTSSATVMLIAHSSSTCADTATAVITVIPCGCTNPLALNYNPLAMIDDGSCIMPEPIIQVPNVFSPNNDGVNDLFYLTVESYKSIRLTIVNRWGNVLFDQEGMNPAWDGMSNGSKMADGVYFYKYVVTGVDGKTYEGNGFLELFSDEK